MRTRLLTLLCLIAAHCGGGSLPTAPSDVADLPSLVSHGGYVVFFRHAMRDASAIANDALLEVDRAGTCVPGSALTAEGEADSVAIGDAFRRRGIRIDRVYASPTCRTQQMASLAFGAHETTAGLAWPEVWSEDEAPSLASVLPALLGRVPPAGTTTVLISHSGVLVPARMGLDIMLDQAEAAVFRPLGAANFEFVGKVPKAEWLAE